MPAAETRRSLHLKHQRDVISGPVSSASMMVNRSFANGLVTGKTAVSGGRAAGVGGPKQPGRHHS
jgi:hypothetical protein